MIRLIACDIDGTLLRGTQREISPAVFREVVRLGKQGVRFCPASGRQYHSLRGLFAPIATSFEDKIARFMKDSDEKLASFNKNMNAKRRSGNRY